MLIESVRFFDGTPSVFDHSTAHTHSPLPSAAAHQAMYRSTGASGSLAEEGFHIVGRTGQGQNAERVEPQGRGVPGDWHTMSDGRLRRPDLLRDGMPGYPHSVDAMPSE
jgi:hypothetical protein